MTFNYADFRSAFQQFQATPDATISVWVDLAENSAMASWFKGAKKAEQWLLVAHMGHMLQGANSGDSSTGVVTSASEGSVSVSFAPPPDAKSALQYWLSSSPYGIQLWTLLTIAGKQIQSVGGLPERSAFRKVGGVWI